MTLDTFFFFGGWELDQILDKQRQLLQFNYLSLKINSPKYELHQIHVCFSNIHKLILGQLLVFVFIQLLEYFLHVRVSCDTSTNLKEEKKLIYY